MCDYKKTKKGLIEELQTLRSRIAELERIEAECRKTEEALSNKTKALDAIIANLKQGIAYLDENDTIIYLNQQCADLFGLKYEDVFRKNVYDFHPPEKSGAVEALINEFKQGKQYLNMVETVGNKVVDNTFHRIQDGDGNYRGILMSAVDVTEQKKAEERIATEGKKLEGIMESMVDGVTITDMQGRITYINKATTKQLGYTQEEAIGKTPGEIFLAKEETPKFLGAVKKMALGETITGQDYICKHKDGTKFPASINLSVLKDAQGKPELTIAVHRDISNRKKAEEALRESEGRYKALFEGAAEGILVADIETKEFKYANPAVCRMLGYAEEELKRLGVRDIHPKEDLEYVISEFESQTRGEKTLSPGLPCLRKDGTIVYVDINTAKVLIDGKECNVGFFTNITESKKTEDELLFKSILLEAQSETSIDGILLVDGEGKSILFNKRFGQMWNIPQKILDTRDDEKMIQYVLDQLKDPNRFLEKVTYLYAHKNEKSRDEIQFKDGKVFDRYSSPLIDSNSKHYGRIWYFSDITERKRVEEELQKARDELEIRVEQRTRDLARVNEELRKEINERKNAEEKLLIYQKQLRSLASELSLSEERLRRRIATDIHDHIGQNLAISKIKLESLAQSISSPELGKSLNDIVELIARIIESTRSLTFELSPPVLYELGFEAAMEWLVRQMREQHGLSTEFRGDGQSKPLDDNVRVLLFQAVRELLVNVAKHAQARNVTVSTQMAGDEIRVDVEDDGVGFDVSQAGSHDYKTGGFGLFSIRERLGHIGGYLNVESKRGVGTRVTLVAPIGHKEENR